jgi:hypothetical protein
MGSRWEVDELDWDRVREQLRERLEATAVSRALISYSDLVADVPELDGPHSHAVADMLGEISAHCHADGAPLLSALAVYKDTREPGPGFFAAAKHLGFEPGPSADGRLTFWAREVERCHRHWQR